MKKKVRTMSFTQSLFIIDAIYSKYLRFVSTKVSSEKGKVKKFAKHESKFSHFFAKSFRSLETPVSTNTNQK